MNSTKRKFKLTIICITEQKKIEIDHNSTFQVIIIIESMLRCCQSKRNSDAVSAVRKKAISNLKARLAMLEEGSAEMDLKIEEMQKSMEFMIESGGSLEGTPEEIATRNETVEIVVENTNESVEVPSYIPPDATPEA